MKTQHNTSTNKMTAKVLVMRKKGLGFAEIGKKLKISDSYAWVLAHDYRFNPKKPRSNNRDGAKVKTLRAQVREMRRNEIGFAEIGKKLKISDSYAWVLAHNYHGKRAA